MKKAGSWGRLFLRKILTGLSLGAVALTFQACYGLPQVSLAGKVTSGGEPVPDIHVSVNEYNYTLTGSDGKYQLFVDNYTQTVQFIDVEKDEFHSKTVTWNPGDGLLDVVLDRKL